MTSPTDSKVHSLRWKGPAHSDAVRLQHRACARVTAALHQLQASVALLVAKGCKCNWAAIQSALAVLLWVGAWRRYISIDLYHLYVSFCQAAASGWCRFDGCWLIDCKQSILKMAIDFCGRLILQPDCGYVYTSCGRQTMLLLQKTMLFAHAVPVKPQQQAGAMVMDGHRPVLLCIVNVS